MPTTTVTTEITIDIQCKECGEKLCSLTRFGNLYVKPCPKCTKRTYKKGYVDTLPEHRSGIPEKINILQHLVP